MQELVARIGFPRFIQIVIECWNELFFLMLLLMIMIGARQDRRSELVRGVRIPMTKELVILYGAVFLYNLCDILDIVCSGVPGRTAGVIVRAGVFVYYAVGGFQTLFFLQVIKRQIAEALEMPRLRRTIASFQLLQLPLFLMLAATPATGALYTFDETNEYLRSWGYVVWQVVTILTFVFIGVVILCQWRHLSRFLKTVILTATVFPLIGFVSGFFLDISMNNIMVAVMALFLYLFYEKHRTSIYTMKIHELEAAKTQLAESRITMMMAQIKPHFIYNTMNAIMELCYIDPEVAAETIGHFSSYLQGKIEAFDKDGLTQFDKELDLIKEYLMIEYADSSKKFRVEYDLGCMDFKLPGLTVQPLVENAVKHGIDRYSEASLVKIVTSEDEKHIYIRVIDNGTAEKGDDSLFARSRGIGLKNVEQRLKMMCDGSLAVEHGADGTTAQITIPKTKTEE